jgi:hypothetical protein
MSTFNEFPVDVFSWLLQQYKSINRKNFKVLLISGSIAHFVENFQMLFILFLLRGGLELRKERDYKKFKYSQRLTTL